MAGRHSGSYLFNASSCNPLTGASIDPAIYRASESGRQVAAASANRDQLPFFVKRAAGQPAYQPPEKPRDPQLVTANVNTHCVEKSPLVRSVDDSYKLAPPVSQTHVLTKQRVIEQPNVVFMQTPPPFGTTDVVISGALSNNSGSLSARSPTKTPRQHSNNNGAPAAGKVTSSDSTGQRNATSFSNTLRVDSADGGVIQIPQGANLSQLQATLKHLEHHIQIQAAKEIGGALRSPVAITNPAHAQLSVPKNVFSHPTSNEYGLHSSGTVNMPSYRQATTASSSKKVSRQSSRRGSFGSTSSSAAAATLAALTLEGALVDPQHAHYSSHPHPLAQTNPVAAYEEGALPSELPAAGTRSIPMPTNRPISREEMIHYMGSSVVLSHPEDYCARDVGRPKSFQKKIRERVIAANYFEQLQQQQMQTQQQLMQQQHADQSNNGFFDFHNANADHQRKWSNAPVYTDTANVHNDFYHFNQQQHQLNGNGYVQANGSADEADVHAAPFAPASLQWSEHQRQEQQFEQHQQQANGHSGNATPQIPLQPSNTHEAGVSTHNRASSLTKHANGTTTPARLVSPLHPTSGSKTSRSGRNSPPAAGISTHRVSPEAYAFNFAPLPAGFQQTVPAAAAPAPISPAIVAAAAAVAPVVTQQLVVTSAPAPTASISSPPRAQPQPQAQSRTPQQVQQQFIVQPVVTSVPRPTTAPVSAVTQTRQNQLNALQSQLVRLQQELRDIHTEASSGINTPSLHSASGYHATTNMRVNPNNAGIFQAMIEANSSSATPRTTNVSGTGLVQANIEPIIGNTATGFVPVSMPHTPRSTHAHESTPPRYETETGSRDKEVQCVTSRAPAGKTTKHGALNVASPTASALAQAYSIAHPPAPPQRFHTNLAAVGSFEGASLVKILPDDPEPNRRRRVVDSKFIHPDDEPDIEIVAGQTQQELVKYRGENSALPLPMGGALFYDRYEEMPDERKFRPARGPGPMENKIHAYYQHSDLSAPLTIRIKKAPAKKLWKI